MQQTRVNFLGARGIEAVVAIDHTRGNAVSLRWLLYDGHGNLVRTLSPNYTLSAFQWRGVWGEVQSSLGTGRGYCANLGHPEDEAGLVYMRARYYEPATGRFISEDPARDGVNWYLYADGNPVRKVDADGQRVLPSPFIALELLFLSASAIDSILGMLDVHRSHSAVVHALAAAVKTLESFGAILTAVDIGNRVERVRNPILRGWYHVTVVFAIAVVSAAAKAVAAREFALMLMVWLDPTEHDRWGE